MSPNDEAPPASRLRQLVGGILLLGYFGVILLATLWPTPLDRGYRQAIDRVLVVVHRNGVPSWFGYSQLEFSANIAMFVPFGFLVALLLPLRVWWLALIICPVVSVLIEVSQGLFLAARFASGYDVLSNSIGALVGIVLAVILRVLVLRRDRLVVARALWFDGHS